MTSPNEVAGFESRQNRAIARTPGTGTAVEVLVHPSYLCQIGESNQGHSDQGLRLEVSWDVSKGRTYKSMRN